MFAARAWMLSYAAIFSGMFYLTFLCREHIVLHIDFLSQGATSGQEGAASWGPRSFISWILLCQKTWFIKWLLWCASSLWWLQAFQRQQDNLVGPQTITHGHQIKCSVPGSICDWIYDSLGHERWSLPQPLHHRRYHHNGLQLHPWSTGCSPLPASLPPFLLSPSQALPQRACRKGEKPP